MEAQNTDVMVIGLGVGGEVPAGKLAEAGLHVTGVEAKLVAVDRFAGKSGHDAGPPVPSEANG
jgi:choline dehydrogenase-like flavoprotein